VEAARSRRKPSTSPIVTIVDFREVPQSLRISSDIRECSVNIRGIIPPGATENVRGVAGVVDIRPMAISPAKVNWLGELPTPDDLQQPNLACSEESPEQHGSRLRRWQNGLRRFEPVQLCFAVRRVLLQAAEEGQDQIAALTKRLQDIATR
jgi:hypothetical protein